MRSAVLLLVGGCLMLAPRLASAQAAAAGLEAVERLLAEHRYADARRALSGWWATAGDTVGGARRAKALYLRAVLADSVSAAERDLLRIAVEHPQAAEADRALFRLAQARSIQGDSAAAAAYLERLVRDHPHSELRADALRLLGRSEPPRARAAAAPLPAASPAPAAVGTPAAREAPRVDGPELTIQVATLPDVGAAIALRDALRRAGFDAHLARLGSSPETVVRVGTYRDRDAAEPVLRRLRATGHAAEIVRIAGR